MNPSPRRLSRLALLLLLLCVSLQSITAEESERDTALVDVLFLYAGADEVKPVRLGAADRTCLSLYLQRGGRESGLGPRGEAGETLIAARRAYLQQQARIFSGDAFEASAFARTAMVSLEWEGMSEEPLAEADQALEWLVENPATPLRPFVNLYSAYRFRAAYEAARLERAGRVYPQAAAGYREQLAAARESDDPLARCLAEQMEALPYLYLPGRGRP